MAVADCLFCRIVAGEVPATKIYEDERALAIEDIDPQAPVHFLVISREHVVDARDLPGHGTLAAHLIDVANRVAAGKGVGESGYRLVLNVGPGAGQSVFHVHLHVLGGRPLAWPPG